jgi:hypothetical protein
MASPHSRRSSVSSTGKPTDAIGEHIRNLKKTIDITVKASRLIGKAEGSGFLKSKESEGKITLPHKEGEDAQKISPADLRQYVASISEALKLIPRMYREKEQREKAERKARRGTPKAQAPTQFTRPLVEFFNAIDLGKGASGRRLQDETDMQLFFKSGVGKLTFGVSMFNVWGNNQKIKNGGNKVVLSDSERKLISEAISAIRKKKVAQNKTEDIALLDAGQIQQKDFMPILAHYRNKEAGDLTKYAEGVDVMSRITKDLNAQLGEKLRASRPKASETKARSSPRSVPRKSEPVSKAVASPKAAKLPVAPAMPAASKAPAKAVASPKKGKKN